jgi:glycosyltransferase involved in cell wall biosynthesis
VTEDWFFASHFLPMARAAREMGLEVVVVTRVREHRSAIEQAGARVVPLEAERRSLNPMAAGYAAGRLAAILRAEKPDIVHCIALRAILVGGAGVDPEALRPAPLPPQPPLKVALVARMLWSKGIDIAVEATRLARARGSAVELSLYGVPDPSNPKAIPEQTLREWSTEPGVTWHRATRDVAAVWRAHHVCCLPSRGGEGLPRTLLEGAACGRTIVTTDVPGCRALVRDGIEGLLVPADDPAALADAFARLAQDPALVLRMGEAARARVLDSFTERHVMDAVKRLYAGMLAAPA